MIDILNSKCGVFLFIITCVYININAQIIEGMVFNELNKEPLSYANIIIDDTDNGTTTDSNGIFKLDNIKPGLYNIIISYTGFQKYIKLDLSVIPQS